MNSASRRGSALKNALHLGFGQITTTILTILLSATLARSLGPAEFGELYILMAIATFAFVLVDWGYGSLIVREAARSPARSGELLGSSLAARAASALIACPLTIAAARMLGHDMHTSILSGALILCWLPQYLGLSFGWVFRGRERMDQDALLNVLHKLATLAVSMGCLALGGGVSWIILAWAAAGAMTLGLAITMYRRLELPKLFARMATIRELLHDGAPLLAMTLAIAAEPFFNANILYKMASAEVVGWYGAAWNIAGTLVAPATILSSTMYPRLSMAAGDVAEFNRTFEVSFRPLLLLAVLGGLGVYLFADVPIALIYSMDKFAPAADILRSFAPVLSLMFIDMFFTMAILAAGRAKPLAAWKVVSVVLSAGLALVLVPQCQARYGNGGLGVMYALAMGELVMLFAAGFLIRDAMDGKVVSDIVRALVAGAATILVFRLLPAFTPFLAIPACIAVFGGFSVLFGAVRQSDINILRGAGRGPPSTAS